MEFFEEGRHSGVGMGAGFPVIRIVFLESRDHFAGPSAVVVPECTVHEGFDPVSDVSFDRFFRMSWEPEFLQRMVECCRDSGEGIDEGAIEIENQSANHGLAIMGKGEFFEACFDRVS